MVFLKEKTYKIITSGETFEMTDVVEEGDEIIGKWGFLENTKCILHVRKEHIIAYHCFEPKVKERKSIGVKDRK
jgi:hypothetical protein